jgi:uncharacterized protein YyaL (SSP411 family)
MMALASLEAFQASEDPFFLDMALDIFSFINNDLTAPQGGFFSALDADSEGEEGKFYVWIKQEIDEILGNNSGLFCRFFNVSTYGNFEGNTILTVPCEIKAFCSREGRDQDEVEQLLEECSTQLLNHRNIRIHPLRDEKIITAWNGLMIAALAKGGAVCGSQDFIQRATSSAKFVLQNLRRPDGRLLRSYMGEATNVPAFLEDYVFFTYGLIELFEASLNQFWLDTAVHLADETLRLFYNSDQGEFSKSGYDAEQMPIRASLEHDGVLPSPFSLAAKNFVRLAHSTDRADLLDHAHALLASSLDDARRHPSAHLGSLQALAMLENDPVLATFRGNPDSESMRALLQHVKTSYIPNLIITSETDDTLTPTVSICARGTCYPPAADTVALAKILLQLSLLATVTSNE